MSTELRDELEEVMNYLDEQAEVLRALDRQLDPFWRLQSELTTALIRTHPWVRGCEVEAQGGNANPGKDYVTGYGRSGAAERAGLFAEQDRLIEIWGPVRARRRVVKAEVDACMRAADRIRKLLAKKPRRHSERAPDLFENAA